MSGFGVSQGPVLNFGAQSTHTTRRLVDWPHTLKTHPLWQDRRDTEKLSLFHVSAALGDDGADGVDDGVGGLIGNAMIAVGEDDLAALG